MNSHMSYAIAQARVADLARDAHRARHGEVVADTQERDATRHCQTAPSRGSGVGSVEPVRLKPVEARESAAA